ncbi:DNA gyrase inhibitor YacG [Aliidiomarina sedimenti]|uniref:DNA gyrase inhibitor YacG n=1 Tax=Aliidiomarina sedimenti TaxID=1933879 RepID=A0ABY0BZR1_9GAMM|nr:DNA gyrase inhibitor YacG [Aliidiomarina sedimenti]RUO30557.1 DNA gyrase inhibitor YacG [Aliidiomarina sedimenti]
MSKQSAPLIVQCPTCDKPVVWQPSSEFRPFCSERCRLIDLGEWANGEKAIAGDPLPQAVNPDADKEDDGW